MDWQETVGFFSLCLPQAVGRAIKLLEEGDLREIRIRAGQPVTLVTGGGVKALGLVPSQEEVNGMAESLCEHALYARAEETRQGFVTLRGGHRMGVCGRVLAQGQCVRALREISSLCVRVAGQWPGVAAALMPYLRGADGRIGSLLVAGLPGSGKTTLLRDCCRQLSDAGVAVCMADERSELAAMCHGMPQLDIGRNTDVLDGCPKEVALRWLLRAMAPDCLATDELGTAGDVQAALEAAQSGVPVLASVHGRTVETAVNRGLLYPLMQAQVFTLYAQMDQRHPGRVAALYDARLHPLVLEGTRA